MRICSLSIPVQLCLITPGVTFYSCYNTFIFVGVTVKPNNYYESQTGIEILFYSRIEHKSSWNQTAALLIESTKSSRVLLYHKQRAPKTPSRVQKDFSSISSSRSRPPLSLSPRRFHERRNPIGTIAHSLTVLLFSLTLISF